MTLHEPTTFLTDLVLGGLTAFLGHKLFRLSGEVGSRAMRLWSGVFACSALAAVVGGFSHGIGPELGPLLSAILWKSTVLLAGGVSFFMVVSAASATFSQNVANIWTAAAALKLMAYCGWMLDHSEFRYVLYDYGSAMIAVVVLHGVRWARGPAPGALWIVGGVAVSLVAAGVQYSGFALHRHFNHNDLYHVIQMGATWVLYRGGRALR